MTKNQIDFVRHKEDVRHNQATEQEAYRHNQQQEGIGWYQASAQDRGVREQARHNLADEQIRSVIAANQGILWDRQGTAALQQAATAAYNAGLRGQELEESIRHNLIEEGLSESKATSYAKMAAASLQQAETAEIRRKDEFAHQAIDIGAGAVHDTFKEVSSLARSILGGALNE